tara:strand:- start:7 stop:399 length:393 start_codon:yes stop_codon:yes gene_type:complete
MADVTDALLALEITDFVLRGEPTNQSEFNGMFRKVTGVDSSKTTIESDDPADFGVTWSQVSAKLTELQNAEPMKLLREERDRRLAETDWMANSDVTMSSAWTTYRQALRDVPAQDGVTGLDDVTWPEKPA